MLYALLKAEVYPKKELMRLLLIGPQAEIKIAKTMRIERMSTKVLEK